MNRSCAVQVTLAAAMFAAGCNDPSSGDTPDAEIESVDYDAIGGGKVMFVGGQNTYVVDADARTTLVVPYVSAPSISPDGNRVTYMYYAPGLGTGVSYFVADVNGANAKVVGTLPSGGPPTWTFDGRQIVMAVDVNWGPTGRGPIVPSSIQQVHPEGIGFTVVRSFPFGPNGLYVCPHVAAGFGPRISASPTGDYSSICTARVIYTGMQAVYSVGAAETEPSSMLVDAATWSPDGTRIAFIEVALTIPDSRGIAIRTVDIATGAVTTVATLPLVAGTLQYQTVGYYSLCWAARGTRILFTVSDGPAANHLYAVTASGGQPVRVTANGGSDAWVSCAR